MIAVEYIGHTSDDGRKQLLLDHLNGTSKLCRENANEFWADIAKFVGQIHDIGKYTSGFQKRINGAENIRVEHAICGAKVSIILQINVNHFLFNVFLVLQKEFTPSIKACQALFPMLFNTLSGLLHTLFFI